MSDGSGSLKIPTGKGGRLIIATLVPQSKLVKANRSAKIYELNAIALENISNPSLCLSLTI